MTDSTDEYWSQQHYDRAIKAEARVKELEKLVSDAVALREALMLIQNAYGDPHAEDFVTTTAREALEGNK